jgi:heme/copper-type cytochrome/quinol oxidase subunit 1
MLYAYGFFGLFLIGGLTGLFLATLGVDVHVHDTYFVVAHFHYIMVGGAIMGYLGGLHFWWPKMTGRMYSEFLSRISAILVFVGFNLTFFPQFILGYMGMPRRYHAYPDEFQVLNVMSSAGAGVLGLGYLLPVIYFLWSLKYGEVAGPNPWGASGLEWQIPSPPPTENFKEQPVVTPNRTSTRRTSPGRPSLSDAVAHAEAHGHADAPHPALQHHFETMQQQKEASTLGMWVFLLTEVLFFGGLFMAYTALPHLVLRRVRRGQPHHLDHPWGNQHRVLIGSSLTMALAVRAAQTNQRTAPSGG